MKVYFVSIDSGNVVVLTDGSIAKVYDGAPSGTYNGIDLYDSFAPQLLRASFLALSSYGFLNNFSNIYCPNEVSFSDVESMLEEAVLVFEK